MESILSVMIYMLKKFIFLCVLSFLAVEGKCQVLNWHLTAHAGMANYRIDNFQGAFLAGFATVEGQELSIGPVFKNFSTNAHSQTSIGGRIYSQTSVFEALSLYIQCDIFAGTKSNILSSSRSPMRLETGAGLIYMYHDKIGLSAGYNLGELNPISKVRKGAPSIKLIYTIPFISNTW